MTVVMCVCRQILLAKFINNSQSQPIVEFTFLEHRFLQNSIQFRLLLLLEVFSFLFEHSISFFLYILQECGLLMDFFIRKTVEIESLLLHCLLNNSIEIQILNCVSSFLHELQRLLLQFQQIEKQIPPVMINAKKDLKFCLIYGKDLQSV